LRQQRPHSPSQAIEDAPWLKGRMRPKAAGKDTTTGHWEMAGIILDKPFPLYPHGFPPDVIAAFEEKIGRKILGNKPASGTEIIKELGEEHMRTGSPIVYTSADSVFQIAAHEQIIPIPELYRVCEIAREILTGPNQVGRVIARPFEGQPGSFTRTANRHDYAVPPPAGMLLDRLAAKKVPVYSIGKISDIFLGRGITHSVKTKNNADGMQQTIEAMKAQPDGVRKIASARRATAAMEGPDIPAYKLFSEAEIGLALGGTNVIHAAVLASDAGRAALKRIVALDRYRGGTPDDQATFAAVADDEQAAEDTE